MERSKGLEYISRFSKDTLMSQLNSYEIPTAGNLRQFKARYLVNRGRYSQYVLIFSKSCKVLLTFKRC